jgi:hypothetical protein
MNSQICADDADISRALLAHVVNPSGTRPRLEITTPKEVFHLVTVEEPILSTTKNGELTFAGFFGGDPMGRRHFFVWPRDGVEEPAQSITKIRVYGQ